MARCSRLVHLHHLEAAGEGGVLLDVFLVLGPGGGRDGAQCAARQGPASRLAASPVPAAPPAPTRVWASSMNRMIGGRALYVLDHLAQALLELALHAGAGLQQAHVQGAQLDVFQRGRHVAGDDAQGEAFHHRGLAHAGLAGEDRVVLAATHEDVHQLADLVVTADDRVQLAAAGLLGEVDGEALEGFLLAHGRWGHGAAGIARGGTGVEAVGGGQGVLRGVADDLVEALDQGFHLDLVELAGDGAQRVAQARGLEDADHQVGGAHLAFAEHQAAVDPAALHRFLDMGRQVGDRGRATGQAIQGLGDVLGQASRLDVELADDLVQVGVLQLQDLVEPVHQLDVGVATQLAEHRGRFDRLVGEAVQLPEQLGTTDFAHLALLFLTARLQ